MAGELCGPEHVGVGVVGVGAIDGAEVAKDTPVRRHVLDHHSVVLRSGRLDEADEPPPCLPRYLKRPASHRVLTRDRARQKARAPRDDRGGVLGAARGDSRQHPAGLGKNKALERLSCLRRPHVK